jgi:hypothetical protein
MVSCNEGFMRTIFFYFPDVQGIGMRGADNSAPTLCVDVDVTPPPSHDTYKPSHIEAMPQEVLELTTPHHPLPRQ